MNYINSRPYSTPIPIVVGTDIPRQGQTGVFINCAAPGDVLFKLPGGNLNVTVLAGPNIIDNIEVIGVVSMTATAVVSVLVV